MLSIRFVHKFLLRVVSLENYSSCASLSVKDVISIKPLNRNLEIRGWVQAVRKHKDQVFVDLTDGGSLDRLQIVINAEKHKPPPSYGSSISVQGVLLKSEHKGQEVELHCEAWNTIGSCAEDYPFTARQDHSPEYIRQFQHLRHKTRTFRSVLLVRNAAYMQVNNFFQDQDFLFIHTPIITRNDCEGGGEVFSVESQNESASDETVESPLDQGVLEESTKKQNRNSNFNQIDEGIPKISKRNEFFKYPAFLTVSGQLHLEALISGLPRVYSFGPTFRAENSSSCHLSEFSMIEAEMAFVYSLDELTKLVECLFKYLISYVMNTHSKEVDQICRKYTQKHKEYLGRILSTPFVMMSYSEVLEVLEKHRKSLSIHLKWGEDFGSEHKKFIIKYCNNIPVFVTEFPASIKPFYVKTDKDGKGFCFDLFAPFGGEICSGSLREENFEILKKRVEDLGIIKLQEDPGEKDHLVEPKRKEISEAAEKMEYLKDNEEVDSLSWYLDIRKYGTVPHGGFGIGFDRALQTILGIPNIRDVVPFPRWRNHCQC